VKVFIARGTEDIGSFPREELPQLARTGTIRRTDTYWHDGMDTWEPVSDLLGRSVWEPGGDAAVDDSDSKPAAPPPRQKSASTLPPASADWRKIAAAFAGVLIAMIVAGVLLIKPETEPMEPAGTLRPVGDAPASRTSSTVVREKIAGELRQRIERLPKNATPPLNTYYFDVSIDVTETSTTRAPYAASIRGRENVVNPETGNITSQTEFTVTAEFAAGEWVYKTYRATTLNTEDRTTSTIRHDSNRLAPPVLVAMLGLKRADYSAPAPSPQN